MENCTDELANSRGGTFCAFHHNEYGAKCRVHGCTNHKIGKTEACQEHQGLWSRYTENHKRQRLPGFRRALHRPSENFPWQQATSPNTQPHDESVPEVQRSTYFMAPRFYCVETICAPCGVVIAWTKFAKSESPTNILNFLESVYPDEASRPDYICIDKACLVLRSCIANGTWTQWQNTSRFIVDSYHYINHRSTDSLCRKWCNPAPSNGSAPNLVVVEKDKEGKPYQKHAFNTQACEQLNAWLGGFETMLRKMTVGNFNWFLHTMLSYHTKLVIEKQAKKGEKDSSYYSDSDSDGDGDGDGDGGSDSGD